MRPSRFMTIWLALAFCSAAGCALVYHYGDDYKDISDGGAGAGGTSGSIQVATTASTTSSGGPTSTGSSMNPSDAGTCMKATDCTNSIDECHVWGCTDLLCTPELKTNALCQNSTSCCDGKCCDNVCCGTTCCKSGEVCGGGMVCTTVDIKDGGAD